VFAQMVKSQSVAGGEAADATVVGEVTEAGGLSPVAEGEATPRERQASVESAGGTEWSDCWSRLRVLQKRRHSHRDLRLCVPPCDVSSVAGGAGVGRGVCCLLCPRCLCCRASSIALSSPLWSCACGLARTPRTATESQAPVTEAQVTVAAPAPKRSFGRRVWRMQSGVCGFGFVVQHCTHVRVLCLCVKRLPPSCHPSPSILLRTRVSALCFLCDAWCPGSLCLLHQARCQS
jgi:hypothetical protein